MSVRKLSVLLFALVSVLLLAGPSLANAADPPPVRSGSAKSNCERITAAGFSPHDYVHIVTRYEEYSIKAVDYFHVFYSIFQVSEGGVPLSLALTLGAEQGNSATNEDAALVEGYVPTVQETENALYRNVGALTDGQGKTIPAGPSVAEVGDTGNLDAYTWTPIGGESVVYQDQMGTATSSESEWVYDPTWAGPDPARMSAIWAGTPACTN